MSPLLTLPVGAVIAVLACVRGTYTNAFIDIFNFLWHPPVERVPYIVSGMVALNILAYVYFSTVAVPEDWKRLIKEKLRVSKALMSEYVNWDKEKAKSEDIVGQEDEKSDQRAAKAARDEGGGEDEKKDDEKKEKKKPPTGKEIFHILFDEIEGKSIVELGIGKDETNYHRMWQLMKDRFRADIDKTMKLTKLARAIKSGARVWDEDLQKETIIFEDDEKLTLKQLLKYEEGNQLQDLIKMIRDHVEVAFGKNVVVPDPYLKEVERYMKKELGVIRWSNFLVIFQIAKPHIPMYIFAVASLSFESAVSHIVWHGMQNVLDQIELKTSEDILLSIKMVLVKLVFIRVLDWCGMQVFNRVENQFRVDLSNNIMAAITQQDTQFFDFHTTGILNERLGRDCSTLSNYLFRVPRDILRILAHCTGILYTIIQIDRTIFCYAVFPVPFLVVAQRYLVVYMRKVSERMNKMNEKTATTNQELLKEIRTVREFVMEKQETRNFMAWNERKQNVSQASSVVHSGCWSAIWMSFMLLRLYCFYIGGQKMMEKTLTYGQTLQIAAGFMTVMHCMRHLSNVIPDMIRMLRPLGRINKLLSSKPVIEPLEGSTFRCSSSNLRGCIEFKDVHFTYPSEPNKPVLQGLSFTAKAGEQVALVGATGCGKSTAVQLIECFYRPQKGQILLDDEPLEDYNPRKIRKQMSIVAQNNVLFSTTIRENILYGIPFEERETVTDEELIAICKKANAWEFIIEFPRKLETFVGERGQKLSGGQKQRIAIARAIVRKPQILLLDEATSALDAKAEETVQEALYKMISGRKSGCTIIIAHKLTTIMKCDKIVIIDKGKNVEEGNHEELLKIPITMDKDGKVLTGWYHDLWLTQMKTDKNRITQLESKLKFMEARCARLENRLLELKDDRDTRVIYGGGQKSLIDMLEDEKVDGSFCSHSHARTLSQTDVKASDGLSVPVMGRTATGF